MRIASTQEFSIIYGRNPMLTHFIRRVIRNSLTITDQFHFYQSLIKYLKGLFLIHCLNFFMKIICIMRINQDSDHLIHVNISSYQFVYDIYAPFNSNPPHDVRCVFLDISKAFDRVWHEGLIYKIKHIGVTGLTLELIQSFLSHRLLRVVLNGQSQHGYQLLLECHSRVHFRASPFLDLYK